jgi:EpsI family protein
MTAARLNAVVALLLVLVAASVAQFWRPTAHMADTRSKVDLEVLFPKRFADWAVDDRMPVQLIAPDTQAQLNKIYNQTLSRTYVNSTGDRIMLSVAYGGDQSDGTRAHRPEVCYPAQGFQVNTSEEARMSTPTHSLRVRHLVARLGGRNEPISYWVVVGDRVALSGTEQKLAQLSYTTRGIVPDGMLVRVSNISTDANDAFALHQRFVSAMTQAIPAELLPRVVGLTGS